MDSPRLEAEILLSRTFWTSGRLWATIDNFRLVANAGRPSASQTISGLMLDWAQSPAITRILDITDPHDVADDRTARCLADAEYAVGAASLVFAHSVIDAAAYSYCRVTALARPDAWADRLSQRRIALADAKEKSYAFLLRGLVETYLSKDVERSSLIEKLDILHAVCRPSRQGRPAKVLPGYQYDRDRLRKLDDDRHAIIHRPAGALQSGDVDSLLPFLRMTELYLVKMVEQKCGLQVNAAHVFRDESGRSQ